MFVGHKLVRDQVCPLVEFTGLVDQAEQANSVDISIHDHQ
jgi:hypothetical protein